MNKDLRIKVKSNFNFYPVTKINWKDFENLFGEKGACAGCWCMYWRMRRKDYDAQRGSGTKRRMKNLVNSGTVPGILAYDYDKPIGWCSVAQREDFPVLENSKVLQRIDNKPVWSVVCFFINKDYPHSAVDFAMSERNLLPLKKVIGEDGRMTALAGKYMGLTAAEARAKFAEDLAAKGLIEKVEDFKHSISICYRCGTVIEPLTSKQWFVDVDKVIPGRGKSLKKLAIEAVSKGKIEIIPDRFAKVYRHWMENLHDWGISRQIWFGHRVPVWYCQSCAVVDDPAGRAGGGPRETKWHLGMVVSAKPPKSCPDCGGSEFVQDPDTLAGRPAGQGGVRRRRVARAAWVRAVPGVVAGDVTWCKH